jgi:hypothetical protein
MSEIQEQLLQVLWELTVIKADYIRVVLLLRCLPLLRLLKMELLGWSQNEKNCLQFTDPSSLHLLQNGRLTNCPEIISQMIKMSYRGFNHAKEELNLSKVSTFTKIRSLRKTCGSS